jgi:glutathionylspermidine synthase
MINEVSKDALLDYDLGELKTIEPWWKLILGNKALLPLLWSMYPNHPSLLPSYYNDPYTEMGGANYKEMKSQAGDVC